MYILILDVVPKCTENIEGLKLYRSIRNDLKKDKNIRVDFHGIVNITDDFLNGFLGTVAEKNNAQLKNISYVRIKSHIHTKIKSFSKSCGQ